MKAFTFEPILLQNRNKCDDKMCLVATEPSPHRHTTRTAHFRRPMGKSSKRENEMRTRIINSTQREPTFNTFVPFVIKLLCRGAPRNTETIHLFAPTASCLHLAGRVFLLPVPALPAAVVAYDPFHCSILNSTPYERRVFRLVASRNSATCLAEALPHNGTF